jgi:hypothetical protein
MTKLRVSGLLVTTFIVIAANSILVGVQTTTQVKPSVPSKSLSLSLAVPVKHIPMGQTPWVSLTVKNLASKEIAYPDDRVYVEAAKGEAPTTLHQRQVTHRLKPGEPSIRPTGFRPLIAPGDSYIMNYNLSGFYDFKEPGTYSVYIELLDTLAPETKTGDGTWVRSPVATFEVQVPTQ